MKWLWTLTWLCKFSSKHVSVWCQKKHFHCNISWRPRTAFLKHFDSKYLYISTYQRKRILFQRCSKILPDEGWVEERINNFLRAARCLGLVKCFTIFILIKFFWNSTIFQLFDTSICSIKTLKFSRQFGLQG